ncbi:MAG: element excision factor XisI family protein [Aggregatilineales bacterium]
MDTGTLKHVLIEEMGKYAGEGLNAYSYLTENEAESLYTVVDIANVRGKRIIGTVLVARVQDDKIIIELDHNNKLLVDALKGRGIPEEQVVLAYLDTSVVA